MPFKNGSVSAGEGMLIIGVLGLIGVVAGLMEHGVWAVAVLAALCFAAGLFTDTDAGKRAGDISIVLTLGLFAAVAIAVLTFGIRFVVTTPVSLLYAFWVYAFVVTGFMTARCCLGWHVGATAAVLTSFLAIGMFLQSLMVGGDVWIGLTLFAVGLGWGADSWRRANGLTITE